MVSKSAYLYELSLPVRKDKNINELGLKRYYTPGFLFADMKRQA